MGWLVHVWLIDPLVVSLTEWGLLLNLPPLSDSLPCARAFQNNGRGALKLILRAPLALVLEHFGYIVWPGTPAGGCVFPVPDIS